MECAEYECSYILREANMTDAERLDWLERMARQKDGLLLHAETKSTGRLGLGLAWPPRSLRDAIDQCLEHESHTGSRGSATPVISTKGD